MKLKMVFVLGLFLMSFSVNSDTYPAVYHWRALANNEWGMYFSTQEAACDYAVVLRNNPHLSSGGRIDDTSCMLLYFGDNFSIISTLKDLFCPSGDLSGSNCVNAPSCVAPQVRSPTTGFCAVQNCDKPICTGDQNPFSTNCKYDNNSGIPINCTDGSTVNVPQTCPFNAWDAYIGPEPGKSGTCADGSVVGYPGSCLDKYMNRQLVDPTFINSAAGAITMTSAVTPVLTNVADKLYLDFPIGVKNVINNVVSDFEVLMTRGRSQVSEPAAASAFEELIKANPTTGFSSALKVAAAAGVAANTITIDPNTGAVSSVCSTAPWSKNQVAKVVAAAAAAGTLALPLSDLNPFLRLQDMPWLSKSIPALENDYRGQKVVPFAAPTNFPHAADPLPNPGPVIDIGPGTIFHGPPVPAPVPPPPTGGVPPPATDQLPVPPTLYSDTSKYFDFLSTANPFSFVPALPALPDSVCTYEIHQTVHVPFMGAHAFNIAPCVPLQPLRTVLAWFFSVLTVYVCILIIFRSNW